MLRTAALLKLAYAVDGHLFETNFFFFFFEWGVSASPVKWKVSPSLVHWCSVYSDPVLLFTPTIIDSFHFSFRSTIFLLLHDIAQLGEQVIPLQWLFAKLLSRKSTCFESSLASFLAYRVWSSGALARDTCLALVFPLVIPLLLEAWHRDPMLLSLPETITPAVLANPVAMELVVGPVATVAMVIHTAAPGVSRIVMLLQSAERTHLPWTRRAHSIHAVASMALWVDTSSKIRAKWKLTSF